MIDPILKAQTFEFEIEGIAFVMKRRSTFVMAEARGFQSVLGTLGGQAAVDEGKIDPGSITDDQTLDMIEGILRAALVVPAIVEQGEPSDPPERYSFSDLAPFHDAMFRAFMDSGLVASPLQSS